MAKREIVLDTETTGFNPHEGHRLVEIGCVEMIDNVPTGNDYHQYINPEREVPEEAFKVHGLNWEHLKQFPVFADVADEFLEYIGDSTLVIHNAKFDINFLNAELSWLKKTELSYDRVIDTLDLAKKKFPGSRVNLDALCKRYGIDNSNRVKHGALLDSELLAEVYLELIDARTPGLLFGSKDKKEEKARTEVVFGSGEIRAVRNFEVPKEDLENHQKFMEKIKDNLWSS